MALLEGTDRAQEIDPTKLRPEYIGEVEFAVRALPQQKTREPDLATRPDDKVGIWQVGGIEIGTDRIRLHLRDRLLECFSGGELFAQKQLDSVGDFLLPAIGRSDRQIHSVVSLGRSFCRAHGRER